MASFAHSLQHHGGDFKYRKRISQTETTKTTHLFLRATSWKWHSSKLQNCLLCLSSLFSVYLLFIFLIYLSLIYLSYTFIYLFIYFYSFIYYFTPSAIRPPPSATRRPHPPSVSTSYRHPFNVKSGALCFSKQHCYWQDRLKIQGFFVLVVAMDPNMHI